MPRITRTADVSWEGSVARGGGTISGRSGALAELPFTLASRIAEPEGKTSPEELLAAAHGGCFTMSLGSELASRGLTPTRLDVSVRIVMDEVEGKGHRIVRSEVGGTVSADGLTDDVLAEAARAADEGCPFSALIKASAEVVVDVRLAGEAGGAS